MLDPEQLRAALERVVGETFPEAAPAVHASLVEEHAAALLREGARRAFAVLDDEGAGVVVEGSVPARAWVVGVTASKQTLTGLEDRARAFGEPLKVRIGGPPGSYFVSGIDARDESALARAHAAGYAEEKRHVDLTATLAAPQPLDARLRRVDSTESKRLLAWIEPRFAPAWREETERALANDAVFVAGAPGAYEGFAAHSGNNAALGTFGPIGVDELARRGGLGAALARAALDDLRARGFERATIPWVDPGLVRFYERLVAQLDVIERVVMAKTL